MKIWTFLLAAVMLVTLGTDAEAARRLGGGSSVGKQSNNVTKREATPASPASPSQAAPANSTATNAAPARPGAAAPTPAPRRPWGAMLGGLAAGLGLAWLAHSLGLGAAFGEFLMIALLVLVAMGLIGWFIRSRKAASGNSSPYAFQGAGAGAAGPVAPRMPSTYRPENVGNDASARPWERNTASFDATPAANGGSIIGSALASGGGDGGQAWGIPDGFDVDSFLTAAKRNFVTLQAAWDSADISSLRAMMTDTMLGEIQSQLKEREVHTGGVSNKTDVVMLDGKLLGIEDLGDDYMASVEFSGMIREDPSAGASPFREVWNMTKPKSGSSGWLVAGVQALQ